MCVYLCVWVCVCARCVSEGEKEKLSIDIPEIIPLCNCDSDRRATLVFNLQALFNALWLRLRLTYAFSTEAISSALRRCPFPPPPPPSLWLYPFMQNMPPDDAGHVNE